MTPRTFVKLAIAAVVSSLAAIAVYAANAPWSDVKASGAKLAPSVASGAKVGTIAINQGGQTLTLIADKDNKWSLKERAGYPADPEPIRRLLLAVAQAEKVEGKTRNAERYGVLDVEAPGKDAKSKGLVLLDAKGAPLASLIIGKKKSEAFGAGKAGTYVRSDKDLQVWLVNSEIDVSVDVRRWIKPGIFETDGAKLAGVKLEVGGEEAIDIARVDGKLTLTGLPGEGKKLKDPGAADAIARAAAQIEAEDVRRLDQAPVPAPASPDVSTVTLKGDKGLSVTLRLRREGDATWVSVAATGDGDVKATADVINAKSKGWEYKIAGAKADQILKKRADLVE
jgi:hypothetical protein